MPSRYNSHTHKAQALPCLGAFRKPNMESAVEGLTLQFLEWIAIQPRTYADAMDAWRSTCPRISIWENALHDGLIRIEPGGASRNSIVQLSTRGQALLQSH